MPGLVKHRLASLARKMAPDLLGGETEDGREPAHHALGDVKHDGLRRAARGARGGRRVHAVLEIGRASCRERVWVGGGAGGWKVEEEKCDSGGLRGHSTIW